MDIRAFKRKDTTSVKIKDPHGKKTDAVVEMYGTDSSTYKKAAVELARGFDPEDEEDATERGAKLIQACIKSWKNMTDGGSPVDPHGAAALAILMDPEFDYFVRQLSTATHNRTLFFIKSGES
jgi:hypothetical protein